MDVGKIVSIISVLSTAVAIVGWIRECTRQQVSRDRTIVELGLEVRDLVTQASRMEDLLQRLEILVIKDVSKKD